MRNPQSPRSVGLAGSIVALLTLTCASAQFAAQTQSASRPQTTPSAQGKPQVPAPTTKPSAPAVRGNEAEIPAEYVIGPEDVLGINFWRDADMTGDVTVRPDGRITLPLMGEFQAAGLTPDALKQAIHTAATKLFEDPTVTVIVRQINSRKVFITGAVTTPGAHALTRDLTVMQLIALAGGLTEFADKKNITITRVEDGKPRAFRFNYSDVSKGKNLAQNIVLKPGDTVVVP